MVYGKFITFEGIDGSGKTTHLMWFYNQISSKLEQNGKKAIVTREPGGTSLGEILRNILLNQKMDPKTEVLLMFASRREHLIHVIKPAIFRGDWVVSDRFTDSTFAYQGGGRGLSRTNLKMLEHLVQAEFQPDLTILLDVSPKVASDRLTAAYRSDRFENESNAFFSRVRIEYLRRAEEAPHRFKIIDATRSIESIRKTLEHVINTLLF
ncbi:MAG: dTMP kinase [Burkholderia sp.]|nr:dTMP kinase [Burkholderia sp.]